MVCPPRMSRCNARITKCFCQMKRTYCERCTPTLPTCKDRQKLLPRIEYS